MDQQAILDALPAEVVVLNRTGHIVAVNEAWRRFAKENGGNPALSDGLGLDYVAACRGLQGKDAAEAGAIADGLVALLSGRLPDFVREYPCHAPDSQHWFALRAAPLHDPAGGAVVVHLDITERKLAEQALQQARSQAAQAARFNAVGVLASALIHELSQPLSAAGFYSGTAVSLLEQAEPDPVQLSRVIHGVEEQIQRAATILQRLREFLRRREMRMRPVAIDEVVAHAMELAQGFAADRAVQISYLLPAPGAVVMADAVQIAQVLVNLVANGIQAIDSAEPTRRKIDIRVDPRPREIEVSVVDTGPGLSAELQTQLFDILAMANGSGLGMGLAISRDIVEAHGGKLWVDPDVIEGASVHFTLPLTQTREPE
jgi:signal transduction histidine kinase